MWRIVIICLVYFVMGGTAYDLRSRIKYRYFDDYLNNLDYRQKAMISGERLRMEFEGSGAVEPELADDSGSWIRPLPLRTGSQRSKEVTCCMLGQLAGDKGYHCFVKFYEARIVNRNYNRPHNRKIAGLQPRYSGTSANRDSDKLMRTFQHCVTPPRGLTFHKCCQLSAMERRPLRQSSYSKKAY